MIVRQRVFKSALAAMIALAVVLSAVGSSAVMRAASTEDTAREMLQGSEGRRGLIVHLGCGDGALTAALRDLGGTLVHGLDADARNVRKARAHVREQGLCGEVSIERWTDRQLPYVDGLVNLAVIEERGRVGMDEVMRVLAPGGVAFVREGGEWRKRVKPRPENIDQWTHFLYDATNNAVSHDTVVGPPHQLQWVGGPRWARSHDHLSSLSAAVSSGGRIFYIVDEAPVAAVVLEPRWKLVARDAASGVVLWKRPIDLWQWHLRGFRSGPPDLARRLVAVGDRVYVTLGIQSPVSALDAATGETLTTYQGTEGTREILHDDGTLYLVAGEPGEDDDALRARQAGKKPGVAPVFPQRPAYSEKPPKKRLMVLDASTAELLWKKDDEETAELMPVTLAVSNGRIFFQNPNEIFCMEADTGKELWRTSRPVARKRLSWTAPTLVVYKDVVLSADRAVSEKPGDGGDGRQVEWTVSSAGGRAPVGELIAFSAENGKRLWSCPAKENYNAPIDVLVADGLVWTGKLVRAKEPGITEGRDPRTGEVKRTRPRDQEFFEPGMGHGRCHRNRATDQYLVLGRSGVEFIDVATGRGIANHWTRGACQYGVLFADGLLFTPPHPCACFIRSKLSGFNGFAPKRATAQVPEKPDPASRLVRGPAYDDPITKSDSPNSDPGLEWPTYRHDAARSGQTAAAVAGDCERCAWQTRLGGTLSPVVVADGKLFVAQVDAHKVHALDASNGDTAWRFTAGGRVDTPPTITEGRCVFGSADGWVYCLRAADGTLIWRFRAAPAEQRIVDRGRLESCWPVHGSVLVRDGVVYCAAGRTSYLEGGVRLCRLDLATGQLLSETTVDHRDPETGHQPKGVVHGTNMPGAKPDILSSDGDSVFMRHNRFDLDGKVQEPTEPHLFAPAGFLDGAWWHRTYWLVGTRMATNYGGWPRTGNQVPAGRLLVVDGDTVYGFGRNQYVHHGAHVGIDGATVFHFRSPRDKDRRRTYYRAFATAKNAGEKDQQSKEYRWTRQLPILARALVKAGDTLYFAGPPELFSTDDPHALLAGQKGGRLLSLDTASGKQRTKCALDSPPVFDGMAAAGGRLYLATMDGRVRCMGGEAE
ncbi:MAG: PQQ-binding-like beta-propeller repeat protein [Planctomycetota bacterium]